MLRRDLIGDLASEGGDLKASVAVPPAASVFPMLKSMGELLHLQTSSLPDKKPAAASQVERQREHEENISAMVLDEQIEEEKDGGRGRKKEDDIEEDEEEDDIEIDYVADCAVELLSVSSSAPATHSVTSFDTLTELAVKELLSLSVIIDVSTNRLQNQVQVLGMVADTHPKLLKSSILCRKMDEYLKETLIMRVMGTMTRAERKEKDPSYFLLSARYQGKARFGLQGAEVAEGLCEDIFHRIESLRAEGVPKSAKQRAVGDLLRKMREEGVSHLKSLVPLEIRQSVQLLSVPPPLACETASNLFWSSPTGSVSGNTSNDVFQKAEMYFTRAIAELDQLRVQAAAPSAHDISNREAQLMVATAENLFCSALRLRCALSAGLENRRVSLKTLQRLHELTSISPPCPTQIKTQTQTQTQAIGEGLTAGSFLSLKRERREYTIRAGCVILDNLIQMKKLLKTAATAHQSDHLEDSPATTTANMSVSEIQHTVQSINRAVGSIDSLVSAIQKGDDALVSSELSINGSKSKQGANLSLYDALAVAGQEKRDAVWYASFGTFHLPPLPTGRSSLSLSEVWFAHAATALKEVESVQKILFALLSADVASQTIEQLQIYVQTLQFFAASTDLENAVEVTPKDRAVQVESKTIKSLSLVIDESLITVQRIRAIAERTGKYKMTTTTTAGNITGCFGESTILTNATHTDSLAASSEAAVENRGQEQGEMRLVDLLSMGMTSFSALQTHKLTSQLSILCDNLSNLSHSHTDDDMNAMAHHTRLLVQQTASPLVAKVLGAEAVLLRDLCESYKSCGKLLYVLLRVFRVLLAKGLCSDETKESEGGEGEGERRFEDDVEGTGMGEGEGKKDVSDQIENEEQLLGLKDDIPKEDKGEQKQESKELSEEEKDKGVEMSQDFEGDMFDIPEDKDQDDRDDDQDDVSTPHILPYLTLPYLTLPYLKSYCCDDIPVCNVTSHLISFVIIFFHSLFF